MKEISQEEFEKKIEGILNGELTRAELAKELETSTRTLSNRILKLSETNPKLYQRFIEKFPYRPKEIKIDIEALAIKVIQNGVEVTSKQVGISVKSIYRKIKTLEKDNPELYNLYVARNTPKSQQEKGRYYMKLDEYLANSEKTGVIVKRQEMEAKEAELIDILTQFEKLVESGMSKTAAAKSLGFDSNAGIWKKYKELKRLETEKSVVEQTNKTEKEKFRDSMKVENEPVVQIPEAKAEVVNEEIEGR